MNPSAPDWILKFLDFFHKADLGTASFDEFKFYRSLKDTGFIYGIATSILLPPQRSHLQLTREEFTKINLFHALFHQFMRKNPRASDKEAIESILLFYRHLEKGRRGFFQKFSLSHNPANDLEHILSARLQEANALLKKNTLTLLTYALLYLDVLAYRHWLRNPDSAKIAYSQLEQTVLNYCFFTLKSKQKKSKYDKLLIELYETSSEYVINHTADASVHFLEGLEYAKNADILERKYILDMCCLTIWEDFKIDKGEFEYMEQILAILKLEEADLKESLDHLQFFSMQYSEKIVLFEYSHPVKHFYKQSAATVKTLILRNKNRLVQELSESGELVVLLGQSTRRDLSAQEKAKVKSQLLDICKTIPSLTIFLLPGGSVLLPLLVKFIPKLLPSAFQDNRIE